MIEVLKQAYHLLLTEPHAPTVCDQLEIIFRQAIAEWESQEPVAWMFQHDETGRMNYVSNDGIHNPTVFLEMNPRYALVCPLYTTPPQRTWVGLTDDDEIPWDGVDAKSFARAIEAKLKQKNGFAEEKNT
jgi:hypothetical protein